MGKKISKDNFLGAFFMFFIALAMDIVLLIIILVEKKMIRELIFFMAFVTVLLCSTGIWTVRPAFRYMLCQKHGVSGVGTVVDKMDEQGRRGRVYYITTAFKNDKESSIKSTSQVSKEVYFKLFPGDIVNLSIHKDYALINEEDLYPKDSYSL